MKKIQISLVPIFFMLLFSTLSNTICAQNFNNVILTINSNHGNTNCHTIDRDYDFNYTITLPPDQTTTSGNQTITKKYRIVRSSLNEGVGVGDLNGRASLRHNNAFTRQVGLEFGTDASGNFKVRYDEAWNEGQIPLQIKTLIKYTETTSAPNQIDMVYTITRPRTENFNFQLAPYLATPQSILVNGVSASEVTIDPTKGCKVYTLSAPNVAGADRYRWVVNPSSILVSSAASLNSNTIQIRPTFGLTLNSIRLEAIQDCDGARSKENTFFTSVLKPNITSNRPAICHNNGDTYLSLPPLGSGVTATWTVDGSKVQLLSGQGTNSIRIRAKGNYQQLTRISVTTQSPCGFYIKSLQLWIGKPTRPVTDPSGYPTVTINHQSFRNFTVTNHSTIQGITGYNWTVSPNQLNLQPTGTFCRIWGNNTGWYNYYVTRSNTCGSSSAAGGAINVPSGNSGGGGFGGPRSTGLPQFNQTSDISQFTVFPNPANHFVQLKFTNEANEELNIKQLPKAQIVDLHGRIVKHINQPKIDVTDLTAGIYLIKINTGTQIISQKLVVE